MGTYGRPSMQEIAESGSQIKGIPADKWMFLHGNLRLATAPLKTPAGHVTRRARFAWTDCPIGPQVANLPHCVHGTPSRSVSLRIEKS